MDVQDRGHCVSGILVVKRPIQQGCGQGEMLEAFMCLQQELNQDHASFALERHLEDPLGENWRRDVALHQTRRSVSKAADAHLGIDGGHRNGTLEGITPRAFGWWMERADEKGVKETARHKPLKMLSYVGEYT